tara:strand:+ start:65 stop:247 length:183 start_codon:yes stop_codon:yes gene_type:complete
MEISVKDEKKFISEVNLNKLSEGCSPCIMECKKIDKRINKRKLKEIETKEVPHLLKVFNF